MKKIHSGDSKTTGESAVFNTLDVLDYNISEKLLDYGCGFGRLVSYFLEKKLDFFGYVQIGVGRKDRGIHCGLVSQENTYRKNDEC